MHSTSSFNDPTSHMTSEAVVAVVCDASDEGEARRCCWRFNSFQAMHAAIAE